MSSAKVSSSLTPEAQERLVAIYGRVVEKMKEVVREFAVTQDELHLAGDYLNRLGQSGFCRSLIDVNLAMTSVDATGKANGGTRPNLEGPFYRSYPERPDGNLIESAAAVEGQPRLEVMGTVMTVDGEPVAQAIIDVWQADNEGHYDLEGFNLAGRIRTGPDGSFRFLTVVPRDYSDHDDDPIGELFRALGRHNRRAAHIHLKLFRDATEVLTTQLFIPGSDYLDTDYVEGAVSDDLLIDLKDRGDDGYQATFDIVLPAGAP